MKTKTIFKTLALAMLMPTMLLTTACSSDDDALNNTANTENTINKGYALPVTVNVTRQGDAATRATYTDNGDGTGSLAFSTGDKLFVSGFAEGYDCEFAGELTWQSGETFSGTIYTEEEWTGTADALFTAASEGYVNAALLPAGYGSYGFLTIENNDTEDKYDDFIFPNKTYTLATSKAAGVEQFSYEEATSYSSGFALAPQNAILNFTITGLAASTSVNVSLTSYAYTITKTVTTDSSGNATFAAGVSGGEDLNDFSLTVAGNPVTLVSSEKTLEAGHIYNITRSAASAPANKLLSDATAEDIGKVVGADGKIYANVAAAQAASTTACAIIAYVGSETAESQKHGLAIAMKDAAAGYLAWKTSSGDIDNPNQYDGPASAIAAKESGSALSAGRNSDTWPAFKAALANSITVSDGISAAPPASGTSGWFLPSLYQWNMIVKGLSGKSADMSLDGNDNYTASSLNTKITAAGGTGFQDDSYWSSTEYDEYGDMAWYFNAYYGSVGYVQKYSTNFVRSAFAF